jgi:hypothetical protein
MDVMIIATRACMHRPNLERELQALGIPYRLFFVEDRPDLAEKFAIPPIWGSMTRLHSGASPPKRRSGITSGADDWVLPCWVREGTCARRIRR